jgi:hypothetical protein
MPTAQPTKSRRGSETRKKSHAVTVRFGEVEFADLDERARVAGLTMPAYIRELTVPPAKRQTRGTHRPSIERELAARILAQLGKLGSNVNQIARAANLGADEAPEWAAAREEVCEAARAVMQVLGRRA